MTDPLGAIVTAAGAATKADPVASEAAKAGTHLWLKVLSPPAEAIGEHLRARIESWSEDALAARVLKKAAKKVDQDTPGSVPPRVAADVFDKAQWAEDEFLAEYLSGVLASARTADGKDDGGVAWTALVGRLSSDQLRMHFVLYSALREKMRAVEEPGSLDSWLTKEFFVSGPDLVKALGWEDRRPLDRSLHALYGLEREQLIGPLSYGGTDFWQDNWQFKGKKTIPDEMQYLFLITGTASGTLLFLQAHGRGDLSVPDLREELAPVEVSEDVAPISALRGWWVEDFADVDSDTDASPTATSVNLSWLDENPGQTVK